MEKLNEILLKSGVITISAIMGALSDVTLLFSLMFSFVFIDNVVAIYELYKIKKGKFDYRKMKTTIEKIIAYGLVLIVGLLLYGITEIKFYSAFAVYIGIYEAVSILHHLSKITGLELFSDLISYIKEKLNFKNWKK